MSKINLLSSKIYNRIAAGEVVERPFSVVKELVENSIDAKAKNITIEIVGGGTTSIKVSDDGIGIEKNDLKKAILPHATSKISKLADLDNISSLGFRGEALSSIASVSKLTIISKPNEQEMGASIYVEGGIIEEVNDCGAINGTEITVNNLFYNTPAREKFLKTQKNEENDITTTVARFILGNADISFKYIADGKIIYQSYGDGIKTAITCVYGVDVLNNCHYIDSSKNGVALQGYIGKTSFTKPNKTYQTFFLNGRFIQNQTVASAIMNSYSPYLMKRQYPFYVLSATIPPETVDVNVHPNKLDVRFADNHIIYGAIYSPITSVLDGKSEALNIVVEEPKSEEKKSKFSDNYARHNFSDEKLRELGIYPPYKPAQNFSNKVYVCDDAKKDALNRLNGTGIYSKVFQEKENSAEDIFEQNKKFIEASERAVIQEYNKIQKNPKLLIDDYHELTCIGQVLNTYLVAEDGLDMYLIDQHAAHERILFDKFCERIKNNEIETQPMLIPYLFDCNNTESEFIWGRLDILREMGFDIEMFGSNSFKVSSIPVCIEKMDIGQFFRDILSDLNELRSITLDNLLKEKLAQKACKSAIKSGDVLDPLDVDFLMENIAKNPGLKCPHGRPVAIKITRTEIDKWFKRIL